MTIPNIPGHGTDPRYRYCPCGADKCPVFTP